MQVKRFAAPWFLAWAAALAALALVAAWTAGWMAGPEMAEARNRPAAVLQEDGRLLVSGGEAGGIVSTTAEALDAIGFFSPVASMQLPREGHAGIRLGDGTVLAIGGVTAAGAVTETAEIYDPALDTWTLVGSMAQGRTGAAALLLPDGRVLVAGGTNAGGAVGDLEVYDPLTQSFGVSLAQITPPRAGLAAALLPDGRVLICGGADGSGPAARADLYDPLLDTLVQAPDLLSPRAGHSATGLLSGQILISGGNDGAADLASAELFDPDSGLFLPLTAGLTDARRDHLALRLPHNGSVLILGGTAGGSDLLSVERFLPWTSTFAGAGALTVARPGAAASPTGVDGALLVLGGGGLATTELFTFATLRTDLEDYRPGQTALITGAGFPPLTLLTLRVEQLTGTPAAGSAPWDVTTDAAGGFATTWLVEPEVTSGASFRLSAETAAGERGETLFRSSQRIGFVTVGAQSGSAEYASPAALSFPISVGRGTGTHSTGSFDAELSVLTALPPGAVASFSPAILSFGPSDTLQLATLTITTDAATPAGALAFTVLALKAGGGTPDAAADDGMLTVDPRAITVAAAADAREYDGGVLSSGAPAISQGSLAAGDSGSWLQTFDSDDAGARSLVVTPAPVSDGYGGANYLVSYEDAPGAITARALTVSATSDVREYDGTILSAVAPAITSGSLAGGDSGFWTQVFDSDDAGARLLAVVPAPVADGNGGANYALSYAAAAGTIGPRALTITAAADSKVYDATTASAAQPTVSAGSLAAGDSADWTQTFDASHAGTRLLSVLPAPVQDGNGGANYALNYETAAGAISPAALTISAVADSRDYDGSTDSAGIPLVSGTLHGAETVTGLAQVFDARDAGARLLSVSEFTVNDGNGGANYDVLAETAVGAIAPAPLELLAASDSREYDGTQASAATPLVNGALFAPDTLSNLAQEFDARDAGARILEVSDFLLDDGNGGANYALTFTPAAGSISPRAITVSAAADSRSYDATNASAAAPTVSAGSLAAGDSSSWIQTFDGDDAGARLLTVTPANVEDGNGGANYVVSYDTAAGVIVPAALDITAASDSRIYDGTMASSGIPAAATFGADTVTGLAQEFDSRNAGARTLSVTAYTVNDGNGGANYAVNLVPASGAIQPAPLDLIAAADDRGYDGGVASVAAPTASGTVFAPDTLTNLTQEFDSRNAGARLLAVSGYVLDDGNGGANYAVNLVPASGSISPAPLELIASADSREYDGGVASSALPSFSGTLFAPDALSNLAQEFDSRNAGARALAVTGFLLDDGNGGANYELTFTPAAGSISPRAITVSAAAESRSYDATTVSLAAPTLSSGSLVAGDSAAWNQSFDSDDAGARLLSVTPAGVEDGNGGANYLVSYETAAGSIAPAPLDVVAASDSRSYDGTALSAGVPTAATFGTDTVTGLAQEFDARHAGARTIAVTSYTVEDGNGGANYVVNLVDAAGSITPATLDLIAIPDVKPYDGTTASAGVPIHSGVIFGGDSLSGLAQEFDGRNAGSRSLSVTSYLMDDGNGGANYAVNLVPAGGDITPAPLELTASGDSRTYDGSVMSGALPSSSGTLFAPDTLTDLAQEFDSRDAGARTLAVSGYVLDDGNGGANYAVSLVPAPGSILPAPLDLSAVPDAREYDGSTVSALVPSVTGSIFAPDSLSGLAQEFDSRHAGARILSVAPYLLEDGNGGANYAVSTADAAGSISPRQLTVTAAAETRAYDATTISLAAPQISGGVLADGDAAAWTQEFDADDAGARLLSVLPAPVSDGNGGANYLLSYDTAAGLITPAPLDIAAAPDDRPYDGSLLSAGVPTAVPLGADTVTGLEQLFDARDAGARTLLVTQYVVNDGNGGANYAVNLVPASGSISPAPLELIASADSREYDGSVASSASPSSSGTLFAPDTLTNLAQEFDSRDAGARILEVSSFLLDDGNGGANYALTFTSVAGSISPRAITVSATPDSRSYDATTDSAAAPTLSSGSLAAGDSGAWSQSFDGDDAGARLLSVTPSNVEDGNAGANYLVSYDTAAGVITPAALDLVAASDNRTYEGTTASTGVPAATTFGTDTVTGLAQEFDARHAGARTLSVTSYTVEDGNGGANYVVNLVDAAGSITPATLDLIAVPDTKAYDGTSASLGVPSHSGTLFGSDSISGLAQEFDSRNSGTRSLSVTGYLIDDGNGGANYAVNQLTAAGSIAPAPLELIAAPDSREYDGTVASSVPPSSSGTIFAPDTLLNLAQEFDSRNAGARSLEVSSFLLDDGNGGANYALTFTSAAGSISPRAITVSATSDSRSYDATTASAAAPTLSSGSLAAGDSGAWTQSFDGDDAGARLLTVTPANVEDGNAGANYVVSYDTAAGVISPAALDLVAASDTRSYDGTTASSGLPTAATFGSDTVTGLAQEFDARHAGARSLSVTSYTVNDGNGGANYVVNLVGAAGSIIPAALDLIAAPDSKDYDGTSASLGVPSHSGTLFGSDSLSGLVQEFDSRNAGTRSLSVTGYLIDDGNGGANYAVNQLTAAGSIAPAPLELIAAPDSREYDGTVASAAAPTYSGTLHGGDSVGQLVQEFDSRNAGARSLAVTVYAIEDGNGGANYAPTFTPAAGSISPRAIRVTPTPDIRTYDGGTSSALEPVITIGSLATGDSGDWTQYFWDRNVGNPRWLTVAPANVEDGNGGANYVVEYGSEAGAILPAPLDIVAASDSRAFDGTRLSSGVPSAAPLGADTVTGLGQEFDSANAGSRTLTVSSYTVNDGNGGANYAVNLVDAGGSISPAVLDVYTTSDSKTYDGTAASTQAPTFTGTLFGSDTLTDLEQEFDSRAAGSRTLVLSNYQVNDGQGGANYQVLEHPAGGSIASRALLIEASGHDKPYDGTRAAIVTLTDDRLPGDQFNMNYGSSLFARKAVGTWPVEVLGLSLSGLDAANYSPNGTAITTASITMATKLGAPPTPELRQPYLAQLHLHGSLSEGNASMHHHSSEAIRTGYDLLWWSDHMERTMARLFVNHMGFEGSLREEQAPEIFGEFTEVEPPGGFLDLSFDSGSPAAGAEHLRVEAAAAAGAAWTEGSLSYEADRNSDHKSLLADPQIVLQARPQSITGDAAFLVRVTLSARPDGTTVGTPNVIEYLPDGMTAPDPSANVRRLPLPALQSGQWNLLTMRPAVDAPPLFYEGDDQALYHVDLVFLAQDGGALTLDLDAFDMSLLGPTDLALLQAQSAVLQSRYSNGLHHEVGMEVAGPDAQGVPNDARDHLVALYPNGVTELIDFRLPSSDPDNYPQSGIDLLHQQGALVSLAHIFGPGAGENPISEGEALIMANRIRAARAWGCDAMEVGYPWRQRPIQNHVDVWDLLSADGVYITGTAVSDNHNVEYWHQRLNRWGSWLRATGADAPSWLEAIRSGQVFFGDPNRFDPDGDLVFEAQGGAFSMGDVVPIQAGTVNFHVAVNGATGGDTLMVMLNGNLHASFLFQTSALDAVASVPVQPGDSVRIELRDWQNDSYLFSNPIYFVALGVQPPPHRAPGP